MLNLARKLKDRVCGRKQHGFLFNERRLLPYIYN